MIKTSNQAKPWTLLFLVPLLLSLMAASLRVQIRYTTSLMDVYIVVFSFMSENPSEAGFRGITT